MEKLILIGAGGFALEVIDLINAINANKQTYEIIGLLDDQKTQIEISEYKIIGTTQEIERFSKYSFVISIANPTIREKIFNDLKKFQIKTPNLIHPRAEFSCEAIIKVDSGIVVNYLSQISALATIEEGVIIDSLCYIGHEATLKSFATIYPGSLISGKSVIGKNAEIGLGSKVIQSLRVGNNTFIGAGSTVVKDIPDHVIAVGTPCKVIKEKINE